jgi:hypothetical protein
MLTKLTTEGGINIMAKRKVRIRSKRLDALDETKLSLAIYLIARSIVEDETTPPKSSEADTGSEPAGETA